MCRDGRLSSFKIGSNRRFHRADVLAMIRLHYAGRCPRESNVLPVPLAGGQQRAAGRRQQPPALRRLDTFRDAMRGSSLAISR